MLMANRQVFVGPFVKRQDREITGEKTFNNVYVKNLSEGCTEEILQEQFGKYGEITSVAIMKDAEGKSKGFGFVNFQEPEAAKQAVEELNGYAYEDKQWVVNKAQRKAEREQELRVQREQVCCSPSPSPCPFSLCSFSLPPLLYPESPASPLPKNLLSFSFSSSCIVKYFLLVSMPLCPLPPPPFSLLCPCCPCPPNLIATCLLLCNSFSALCVVVVFVFSFPAEGFIPLCLLPAPFGASCALQAAAKYEKFAGCNLYIKNLDDTITDDDLRTLFQVCLIALLFFVPPVPPRLLPDRQTDREAPAPFAPFAPPSDNGCVS